MFTTLHSIFVRFAVLGWVYLGCGTWRAPDHSAWAEAIRLPAGWRVIYH